MRVVAVIPAYNESKNIALVVSKAKRYVDSVVVSDDKSTDDTVRCAREAGARVLENNTRYKGAGIATSRGIALALEDGADLVVTLDGDGQHNPDEIPELLRQVDKYDVVLGVRNIRRGQIPILRWMGNQIFRLMVNAGSRVSITDTECGFRVFKAHVLRNIKIESNAFGFCDEMVIKARAVGYKIAQVPIQTIYGDEQRKYSFIPAMKRGLEIPCLILKWRWKEEWSNR